MYSSEHFGRLFWVDDELEFKSCPQFTDGTGDFEQEDYVSDWSDLEGVNIGLLFDIYKVELLNKNIFVMAKLKMITINGYM